MPLGDDQKAMLRLLARGQSYEDIAALMGVGVEEVSARAKGAVEQLEAEGIPAPALPEAPTAATGSVAAQPPAEDSPPPVQAPREPASGGPAEPAPAQRPPAPPLVATPAAGKPGAPRDRNRSLAIGGGIAVLIAIAVVLGLLLSGGGDGGGGSTSAGEGSRTTAGGGAREPTAAQLTAVDGSQAAATAQFGRFDDSLGLGISASGLEPLPKGEVYMVWLQNTPRKLLPLTAIEAEADGRIEASYEVPTEAVVYLASGEFDRMTITRAVNRRLQASLVQANERKDFPAYIGTPVLEGEIVGPIIGAAKRLEERRQEGKEGE